MGTAPSIRPANQSEPWNFFKGTWLVFLLGPRLLRYVAAYLLAALGGNESPSAGDIKKILGSVGIEVEDDKLNKVISELKGKNLQDLITEGNSKLASMPSGGAAPAAAAGAGAAADGEAKEDKEEAKKESSEEESDDDMGFGLFD